MQEQLLGYLMGALEDDESREVELALKSQPDLQEELRHLEASLAPLKADREPLDPPSGLAERTAQMIAQQAPPVSVSGVLSPTDEATLEEAAPSKTPSSLSPVREAPSGVNRWSFSDLSVAGGVFLAAGLLLLPAIEQSRFLAQRTVCQDNLRQMGRSAIHYSQQHEGYFPEIEPEGNLSVAGMFPVRLLDGGYLNDETAIACPTSAQSAAARNQSDDGKIVQRPAPPTVEELSAVNDPRQLNYLHQTMGGDYAYPLGNMEGNTYVGAKNLNRSNFPIVVDQPIVQSRYTVDRDAAAIQLADDRSANHGGHGQNVLFEDGHVQWMSDCFANGKQAGDEDSDRATHDNFFKNDQGDLAAGRHRDDAVCAPSGAKPMPRYILRFPE